MSPRTPLVTPQTGLVLFLCCVAPLATAPTGNGHLSSAGRFWHITDLHLDPSYRMSPDPTAVCASSKGAPASDPGPFGDYLCDAPFRLIRSALSHVRPLVLPQDFVIWTGDSPPHVPPDQLSTDLVIQVLSNLTQTVSDQLPGVQVFPAVGNHDYWPQDQMPTEPNDIYKAAARLWKHWLQPEALLSLSQGGFYSQLVRPGLRIVSLNTILYYGPDKVTVNMSDPAGQFQWLQDTLQRANLNQEQVFIIAHVPVGYLPFTRNITAMREVHNERLVGIFRKYSHVIAGQFYGHTHRDSVMVLLDPNGKAVNSVFVAPAVTPIRNVREPYSNNPGFRLYLFDQEDFSVSDLWQYFLNLTEANTLGMALWRLEYVMTEAFGLPDLRPESLLKLGLSLTPPQSRAFQTYFTHFSVSYSRSLVCDRDCQRDQVCSVLHLDRDSYSRCLTDGGALQWL